MCAEVLNTVQQAAVSALITVYMEVKWTVCASVYTSLNTVQGQPADLEKHS